MSTQFSIQYYNTAFLWQIMGSFNSHSFSIERLSCMLTSMHEMHSRRAIPWCHLNLCLNIGNHFYVLFLRKHFRNAHSEKLQEKSSIAWCILRHENETVAHRTLKQNGGNYETPCNQRGPWQAERGLMSHCATLELQGSTANQPPRRGSIYLQDHSSPPSPRRKKGNQRTISMCCYSHCHIPPPPTADSQIKVHRWPGGTG